MNTPRAAWLKIIMLAMVITLIVPWSGPAASGQEAQATEDILHMVDGRQLHGRIVSETTTQVVFEIVHSTMRS